MISACSAPLTGRVPFRFHLMALVARVPALLSWMRRKSLAEPEWAARRSIPDPVLRAQTFRDPQTSPLIREFQVKLLDQLAARLSGTRNDIIQSRAPFGGTVEKIGSRLRHKRRHRALRPGGIPGRPPASR